jgi:hypothetical protein
LVEGAADTVVPPADPHAPLIPWLACTATVVVDIGDVPPGPLQFIV